MLFGKKMGALPAKVAWRETEVSEGIQAKTACSRNRSPGCFVASASRTTSHWSKARPSSTTKASFQEQLDQKAHALPELFPLIVIRVEGSG
jgi:hypothetical protein